MIFLSQVTLLRWLAFLPGSLTVTLTFLFFWISFSLLMLIVILIMWLSQFPLTSCQIQKGMPHFIALLMTILMLIGVVFVIFWEMFLWKDTFELGASATASEFCEWFMLELMYISLIVIIQSSLTHLHGFQLLLVLPYSS